jgi:alpha-tubulin suppressor-like RCC1 family protein
VELPPGVEVLSYSAKEHACALLADMQVYCWGKNDVGQSDWTVPGIDVLEPRPVEGLGDLVPELVTVGYGLSCAAAGTELLCWGGNDMPEPTAILGTLPAAARSIAAGRAHGCGVLEDESIRCFGNDERGQLGDGEDQTMGGVGVAELPAHEGVRHLAAGRDNTCAVLRIDGSDQVYCWGENADGQGGSMPSTDPTLPVPRAVTSLEPGELVALAVGDTHACVVEASGRLFCWGSNEFGMSDPWATEWSFGAHEVAPPEEELAVVDVAVGLVHTCAQLDDARVWCWGCNAVFQLGPQHDANTCEPEEMLLGEVVVPCDDE